MGTGIEQSFNQASSSINRQLKPKEMKIYRSLHCALLPMLLLLTCDISKIFIAATVQNVATSEQDLDNSINGAQEAQLIKQQQAVEAATQADVAPNSQTNSLPSSMFNGK